MSRTYKKNGLYHFIRSSTQVGKTATDRVIFSDPPLGLARIQEEISDLSKTGG